MAGDLFVGGALKFFVCIAALEGGEIDFDVGGVDLVPAVYYDALAEGEEKGGVSLLVKEPILFSEGGGIPDDGVGEGIGLHDLLGKGSDKEVPSRQGDGVFYHDAISRLTALIEENTVFIIQAKDEIHREKLLFQNNFS